MLPDWSIARARPECRKAASFWNPVAGDCAEAWKLTALKLPVEAPLTLFGIKVF